MAKKMICLNCNKKFGQNKIGRPKIYCSDKCRQKSDKRKEYMRKYKKSINGLEKGVTSSVYLLRAGKK